MILAFDTYYYEDKAKTVCVAFEEWSSCNVLHCYSELTEHVEEYVSGEFYKRELPCILSLLEKIELEAVEVIIVDGYVFLDDANKPGLGYYLYEALGKRIPVVGVAKTNFALICRNKRAVLRGESRSPLYVTAVGIGLDEAASNIRSMDGEFRIPFLLKEVDRFSREK